MSTVYCGAAYSKEDIMFYVLQYFLFTHRMLQHGKEVNMQIVGLMGQQLIRISKQDAQKLCRPHTLHQHVLVAVFLLEVTVVAVSEMPSFKGSMRTLDASWK